MTEHQNSVPHVPLRIGLSLTIAVAIMVLTLERGLSGRGVVTPLFQTPPLTVATFWQWVLSVAKLIGAIGIAGIFTTSLIRGVFYAVEGAQSILNR